MKRIKIIFLSLLFITVASFASAKPIEVTVRNCTSNEYIAIGRLGSKKNELVEPGKTATCTLDDSSYDYTVCFDYNPKTGQGMGDAVLVGRLLNNAFIECGYEDGNLQVVYVTYRYSLLF
ncbi:MAG: hypothetical protein IKK38_06355 [Spirochaetaceae bacterium]|nr:hypothetical protein [Spirochaetaceae bacterium]